MSFLRSTFLCYGHFLTSFSLNSWAMLAESRSSTQHSEGKTIASPAPQFSHMFCRYIDISLGDVMRKFFSIPPPKKKIGWFWLWFLVIGTTRTTFYLIAMEIICQDAYLYKSPESLLSKFTFAHGILWNRQASMLGDNAQTPTYQRMLRSKRHL